MLTIPMLGMTAKRVVVGRLLHRVPTEIVFASLREDCNELLPPGWYACVLLSDGNGALRGNEPLTPAPEEEVQERMVQLAALLNAELHENGHWVVAWADQRLHMMWRDADGDAQFISEIDEPWARVRTWSVQQCAEPAEAALRQMDEFARLKVAKPEQRYRRALGERRPSATRH